MSYDIGRMRREMKRQYLSWTSLGKKADLSPRTVKNALEHGRGYPETFGKIADALELSPDDVVIDETAPVVVTKEVIDLPQPRTPEALEELVSSTTEKAS